MQSNPQSIPAGTEVTAPPPSPDRETERVWVLGGRGEKVAVTTVFVPRETTQAPVPEHPPPDHPSNWEAPSGAAESVTTVPLGKFSVQSPPH